MRVRVHLNLAEPKTAETVVKVRSPRGGWVTVAYAQEVVLTNAEPVVDHELRERVRSGALKKTPHAFIDGDLVAWRGRWRDKAPSDLQRAIASERATQGPLPRAAASDRRPIGYNPRSASCFYAVPETAGAPPSERFVRADRLHAIGWAYGATGGVFVPTTAADLCAPEDRARTSVFERIARAQGRETTQRLLNEGGTQPPPSRATPRR